MSKKQLSEADICDRIITPALLQDGWLKEHILREHWFTACLIIIRGRMVIQGRSRSGDPASHAPDISRYSMIGAHLEPVKPLLD